MIEHADKRSSHGWIDTILKDTIKMQMKFDTRGRKFISSSEKGKHNTVFYRNGLRYFIAIDNTPIATGLTAVDCARKAFLDGKIDDETYVLFTRGYAQSQSYRNSKSRKEKR